MLGAPIRRLSGGSAHSLPAADARGGQPKLLSVVQKFYARAAVEFVGWVSDKAPFKSGDQLLATLQGARDALNLAEGGTTNVHKARSDGFGPPHPRCRRPAGRLPGRRYPSTLHGILIPTARATCTTTWSRNRFQIMD